MGDVDEKIVAVSASGTVASAIANASVNATGGIPSDKLNDILMNVEYMNTLQPLIANAVEHASSIQSLRDAITNLFENEAKNNTKLSEALTALQKKLQSFYLAKSQPNELTSKGGKRRKSKKRNYYKKRRATKRR
jgi:hypothetical protein